MNKRKILLNIVRRVLKEIQPQALFRYQFSKKSVEHFRRIVVISIGKAARGMAQAVLKNIPRKPDQVLFADSGHPLPNAKSIENTKRILSCARQLTEKDLAIVLISGGGSAMLCAPSPGITLNDKIKITQFLLKSGATIQEMNIVRKHISNVKGGKLAQLLYPATVWGYALSDVVGNDLGTIASGPISPDPSTIFDAKRILKKYRIRAPKNISETPKPNEKYFQKVKIEIIANHNTVLKKAIWHAKRRGLKTISLGSNITGEARLVAKKILKKSRKGFIVIGTGETTVTCIGTQCGCGGRNQELILAALQFLKSNQTILSIGTDGIDGICPKPMAGAIADYATIHEAEKKKLNIKKILKNNNSYEFFQKVGGHIKIGATGTNLGDLIMVLE